MTELTNSGYPFGIGLLSIFQGSMLYMMDTYGPFAASAVSQARMVRALLISQISTTTLVRYCKLHIGSASGC